MFDWWSIESNLKDKKLNIFHWKEVKLDQHMKDKSLVKYKSDKVDYMGYMYQNLCYKIYQDKFECKY